MDTQDTQTHLPFPKFRLGGHRQEVSVLDWSSQARYIATIDEGTLRVWEDGEADGRERLYGMHPEKAEITTPLPLPTPTLPTDSTMS